MQGLVAFIVALVFVIVLALIAKRMSPPERKIEYKEEPYFCAEKVGYYPRHLPMTRFYYLLFFLLLESGGILIFLSFAAESPLLVLIYIGIVSLTFAAVPWKEATKRR